MNNITYSLTRIRICALHGEFDYDIKLENNRLVIVSENGMGKTTIVNIIYFSISRQWIKLMDYDFSKIIITINESDISLEREEIKSILRIQKNPLRNLRRFPPMYRRTLENILNDFTSDRLAGLSFQEISNLANRYNIDPDFLFQYLPDVVLSENNKEQYAEFDEKLKLLIEFGKNTQILYLPTFRRIEQDLTEIFPELETNLESFRRNKLRLESQNRPYLELVEFGMEDVEEKIKARLYELNNNLNSSLKNNLTGTYLKDIINGTYKNFDLSNFQKIEIENLNEILDKIDRSILADNEKDKLRDFVTTQKDQTTIDEDSKIVGHFISRLMDIYKNQKREEKDVDDFVHICKEYMIHKNFVYDREELEIKITLNRNERPIKLKNLSSGEKQIVSLFSHLYLSKEKKYFVIIDEPELSLSVLWQKRLLPDIVNSNLCTGMLAVTHSPYIFQNELKPSTKSLEQFRTLTDQG